LGPRLHAGERLVSFPGSGADGPRLDRKDDSVSLPTWLGIPGLRHTLGLSRWWHFSVNLLWLINGVAFYVLLFSSDQWRRLVPVTWEVFPAALSTAVQYASLNFPVDEGWTSNNGHQRPAKFPFLVEAAIDAAINGKGFVLAQLSMAADDITAGRLIVRSISG
jgi:hypothetical protein